MFLNSVVSSYRLLFKSKIYTAINLLGLVLGLTVAFILLAFLINELSYNRCFENHQQLFRVLLKERKKNNLEALTPLILAPHIKSFYPEIRQVARVSTLTQLTGTISVSRKEVFYDEPRFICSDPSIVAVLSLQMLARSAGNLLNSANYILISRHTSLEYFGSWQTVGKHLLVKANGKMYQLIVQGVYMDLPWNSSYQADFIASTDFLKKILIEGFGESESALNSLNYLTSETLVLLNDNFSIRKLERKMPLFLKQTGFDKKGYTFLFQNFGNIYFYPDQIENDFLPKGNTTNLLVYGSLALFILLLAGINYSILSTARSALRFKEIGVKKVLGASKNQLRMQILAESVLMTFIAFPLAFLLLGLIDPFIREFFGYEICLYSSNMRIYLLLFASITMAIGFLSGAYVAFYLSALDPLNALKIKLFSYRKFSLGKVFTVFQLFITLSLLIGFITVYLQINHFLSGNLGLKKENLLFIRFNPKEFSDYQPLKASVSRNPHVIAVSGLSVTLPESAVTLIRIRFTGIRDTSIIFESYYTDYRFFPTMGISFVSGRDINPEDSTDIRSSVIINREAQQIMQAINPGAYQLGDYKIIGVVNNFNVRNLYSKIAPAIFRVLPTACQAMLVRYETGWKDQVLADIEHTWKMMAPSLPFQYQLFDKELDNLYSKEKNFERVVAVFTFLAFLITGMGLFGLALLLSEQKMKEVAIRKVFGASDTNIIFEMQKEFYFYITIAAVIAVPFTWYFMERWLNSFYYHINFSWQMVAVAVISVTIYVSAILLLRTRTVLKENPLNAIKYE